MKLTIESTADGSPTLYREDIDEHYHSIKGALAESMHVYIDKGWRAAANSSIPKISVFEVGFGSGLNAALTALEASNSSVPTIYYSVELYPLPANTVRVMASEYHEDLKAALTAVNAAPWGMPIEINPCFTLNKMHDNLLTMKIPSNIDVVYFDAFAPEKQPEIWSEEIFRKIFHAMNPGGRLTTYCAKGVIRRMLQDIGFSCERLPGPPGGKREILRATKQ
ncbi:MAG: tRNA (5-methylaminomethyl-2-thiouridine)(34)-methyltransferase MnmD [Muribaculaceae bacterium]|nr:tRNA (5-methylaminomethyl-2-thiouridine)(34)-methyltransferase MnmD [Muribaculaceae bacterium]